MESRSGTGHGSCVKRGKKKGGKLVTQSCLTLCDPKDCSQPGSSVHGILQGKKTGVGCHVLPQ